MRGLLVGSTEHPEFATARQWLNEHLELATAPDVERALEQLRAADDPHVILLVQARRDTISQLQIEQLHRAAPLARLVGLLGSWCEGEVRSGRPWTGVKRIYWHQWTPQLLATTDNGPDPDRLVGPWNLPRTATSAEHLLQFRREHRRSPGGIIGISALSFSDFDTLADVCRVGGFSALWLKDPETIHLRGLSAILCSGGTSHGHDLHRIEELIQQFSGLPVVAVLGYPRLEDRQRVLAAGAAGLLSKPYLVDDLLVKLNQAIDASCSRSSRARSA